MSEPVWITDGKVATFSTSSQNLERVSSHSECISHNFVQACRLAMLSKLCLDRS